MGRFGLRAGQALDWALRALSRAAPEASFKLKRHFYRPDMELSLRLLARGGFTPASVVDVGAHLGDWAQLCRAIFPESRVLMIEPAPRRVQALRALCGRAPGLEVAQALLGAEARSVNFREQDTNSGVVPTPGSDTVTMTTVPLDELLAAAEFPLPQLLKIDVQGYDLEVLKGATTCLRGVEVIIVELSLIGLHPSAPSFRDAIDWLDEHGFRLLDISGLIRRPVDHALWQIDAMFARKDSALGHPEAGW